MNSISSFLDFRSIEHLVQNWRLNSEYNASQGQLNTTAEIKPWTVGTNIDTPFKLGTALNFVYDKRVEMG